MTTAPGATPAPAITTAPRPEPLPAPSPAGAARAALTARWARWRWPAAVVALALVAVGLSLLGQPRGGGRLDPDSATPQGARALARVLADQGVEVRRVTRSAQAELAAVGGSTLLVTDTGLLGSLQLTRIAGTRADLVLVEPDTWVLDQLAPDVEPAGVERATLAAPGCADPAATAAGRALAGGRLYRATGTAGTTCYSPPDGAAGGGSYLAVTVSGRRVTLIGQGDLLTNEHLDEDGNAALALHTLGRHPRLTWYSPDPFELGETEEAPSLLDLVPPGVTWSLFPLLLAVLALIAWRARRLGPLAHEPLPVVVRATETHEGRARLYRRARARGRAAATLRTATLHRLAARLGSGSGATPESLATTVAEATGAEPGTVWTILLGPEPADDAALVRLARDLDWIERALVTREVRRP